MSGDVPPLPQYAFMAWCSVKHRDNFTFTYEGWYFKTAMHTKWLDKQHNVSRSVTVPVLQTVGEVISELLIVINSYSMCLV
jgi:hypothetical protein